MQNDKYVTNFKKKAEFFTCFFAKQNSVINNSSELVFNFFRKADKSISTIAFNNDSIATFIQNLGLNNANGHKWPCKLLDLILQSCI